MALKATSNFNGSLFVIFGATICVALFALIVMLVVPPIGLITLLCSKTFGKFVNIEHHGCYKLVCRFAEFSC